MYSYTPRINKELYSLTRLFVLKAYNIYQIGTYAIHGFKILAGDFWPLLDICVWSLLQGEQVMLEEAVLMLWLERKKDISFIWSLLDIVVWSLLQGEQGMLEEAVLMLWLESKKAISFIWSL
jgi:hypothetical protein